MGFADPVTRPPYLARTGQNSKTRGHMCGQSSSTNHKKANPQNIADAIRILFEPGQVVELRAPKAGKFGTISGYFSDHEKLAQELADLSGGVGAVYYTLNPVNASLLARANNRTKTNSTNTTSDAPDNITRRRWLLVDCDPVRPSDISSTAEEKQAAKQLVSDVKMHLKALGWPEPVIADSGNGYHLLYHVDLPNDNSTRALVESVLKALASRFDNDAVKIDQKVFNASRITKAYGTMACKGDSIPERPHRLSKMFKAPDPVEVVNRQLLEALAGEAPKSKNKTSPGNPDEKTRGGWSPGLVESVLDKAEINRGEAIDYKGVKKWQHDCLNNSDHHKPDAFTILDEGGYALHHCSHNSCSDLTDADWRKLWEEKTGEAYPWPNKGNRGVSRADTLPETPYISPIEDFSESVSTPDTASDPARYSDTGNAMRLAKLCGEDIVYCRQSDEYFVWDGTRWVRDLNNVQMLKMAKAVTEEIFREAESCGEEMAKALRKHALNSQSVARLLGMVNLAKIYVRNINRGDFDRDPWLLNCLNGTIELKSGKCREHHREDLISKIAPVKFDPTANCPLWKKCLDDWMLGGPEKVSYLQRLGGYTITGCTNEEVMPILHGSGRNGKSKFYVTIYNVLGDGEYAKAANFDSFVVKRGDEGMPNDVAGWCGMRLIVASEGEHSKRLAEAKLKRCIGRDPVVGEFKYQEEFTYLPTYKIWLVTNPKPRIVGTTEAIWDKIHFIAWRRYYSPNERDPELQEKLNTELPGILNWLIEGCLQWQKKGLSLPDSMKEDTEAYRHEQDVVGRFIDEECVTGNELTSPKKLTYVYFKEWAEDAGEHYTMTQVEFNEKLLCKFEEGRSNAGRYWRGFKLKRQQSDFDAGFAAHGITSLIPEDAIN
jgi:P4 family phage/plasmid primase-like protien